MRHLFTLNGEPHEVGLTRPDGRYRLLLGTHAVPVLLELLGHDRYRLDVDGVVSTITLVCDGDVVHLHCDGAAHELRHTDPVLRFAKGGGAATVDVATAPMPGTVVALNVAPGGLVRRGDTLIVIESMKLETAIKAWRDGTIESVHVGHGATFERGAALITLVPEEAAS